MTQFIKFGKSPLEISSLVNVDKSLLIEARDIELSQNYKYNNESLGEIYKL